MIASALAVVLVAASAAATPSPSASSSPSPSPAPASRNAKSATASPSPVASATPPPKVAFLVHAPGIPDAPALAAGVASGLSSAGYLIMQRGPLLQRLGLGSGATPPDPLAPVREKLAIADQKYLDLDLAAADAALRDAEVALVPVLGDPDVIPLLRRALERRAIVLLANQRLDDATEKLRALYILDPEYKPDASLLSPQFRPAFERAANAARTAPRGTVRIETNPPGADVYVDGHWLGASPTSPELRAGQHVVQVRAAGYAAEGSLITVDPTLTLSLPFQLLPLKADAQKAALVRSIETSTLPGGRERLATELRKLTGADAVAFVIARPVVDGVEVSAEVFHGLPGAPPAKTSEVPSRDVSAARGVALAKEIAALLEAPPPPPPVEPVHPLIVSHPARFQVGLGVMFHTGSGWNRLKIAEHAYRSGTLSVGGGFRLIEERGVGIDLTGALDFWAITAKAYDPNVPTPPNPPEVSFTNLTASLAPRISFEQGRLQEYFLVGVGVGFASVGTISHGNAGFTDETDTNFIGTVHTAGGVGLRIRRWGSLAAEGRLIGGDAEFPTLAKNLNVKYISFGGEELRLVWSTRF